MLIEPHRACEPGLLEVLLLPGFADAGGRWASARRPRAASQRSQTGVRSSQFRAAVGRASRTLRGISWFEVLQTRGQVEAGKLNYQVVLKVGFTLEEP